MNVDQLIVLDSQEDFGFENCLENYYNFDMRFAIVLCKIGANGILEPRHSFTSQKESFYINLDNFMNIIVVFIVCSFNSHTYILPILFLNIPSVRLRKKSSDFTVRFGKLNKMKVRTLIKVKKLHDDCVIEFK